MIITGVAMYVDGEIQSLPKPARHHDIIAKFPMPEHKHGEQGFIDDMGQFFEREMAAILAIASGQIKELKWPPNLYSEDLW